ncbi:hypothetical protein [Methylobacterium gnaphalii]|uniref:hypothetical protein n=1 Tax=Methylobacterium gnaphalii TaxID=1010610 RepID=UPI0011BE8564|nr:hypothetical protein [Methylobacterium gnaphalii]GJD70364.1 hypothetical protein MMMDOFMJ_3310 [Methylobacterium gnaphalii]
MSGAAVEFRRSGWSVNSCLHRQDLLLLAARFAIDLGTASKTPEWLSAQDAALLFRLAYRTMKTAFERMQATLLAE